MYIQEKVSSEEAMQLIQHVIKQTEKYKRPVAVSICGPEGELIGFIRMDGTSPAASRIAQNKAYTASIDRTETSKMGERMRGIQNNKVIGGIGVSGLPEADDIIVAKEAVKAVFGY